MFNITTGISESKTLTKHISCECKCKFDGNKCNSDLWLDINKCRCECKKNICEKVYVWNPATCNCQNRKYLPSIMDDSVIICDEVIEGCDEEMKTIPANFNEKKVACKTPNVYVLLVFLFVTISLLITVSIYCYLIKDWGKQKHLLPFHDTNLY